MSLPLPMDAPKFKWMHVATAALYIAFTMSVSSATELVGSNVVTMTHEVTFDQPRYGEVVTLDSEFSVPLVIAVDTEIHRTRDPEAASFSDESGSGDDDGDDDAYQPVPADIVVYSGEQLLLSTRVSLPMDRQMTFSLKLVEGPHQLRAVVNTADGTSTLLAESEVHFRVVTNVIKHQVRIAHPADGDTVQPRGGSHRWDLRITVDTDTAPEIAHLTGIEVEVILDKGVYNTPLHSQQCTLADIMKGIQLDFGGHGPGHHTVDVVLYTVDANTGVLPHSNCRATFVLADPAPAVQKPELPTFCVGWLSCRRVSLLIEAVTALDRYLKRVEPSLDYMSALIDNGSSDSDQARINAELGEYLDMTVMFKQNRGISHALNTLHFGLCQSEYVLKLEDDFVARADDWPTSLPMIAMARQVLDHDPLVMEVWLGDFNSFHYHNRSEWFMTTGPNPVQYRRQCRDRRVAHPWGTYTHQATLKRQSTIEEIGRFRGINFDGEMDYVYRVNQAGLCSAHLCMHQHESKCVGMEGMYGEEEIPFRNLFDHTAKGKSSQGHSEMLSKYQKGGTKSDTITKEEPSAPTIEPMGESEPPPNDVPVPMCDTRASQLAVNATLAFGINDSEEFTIAVTAHEVTRNEWTGTQHCLGFAIVFINGVEVRRETQEFGASFASGASFGAPPVTSFTISISKPFPQTWPISPLGMRHAVISVAVYDTQGPIGGAVEWGESTMMFGDADRFQYVGMLLNASSGTDTCDSSDTTTRCGNTQSVVVGGADSGTAGTAATVSRNLVLMTHLTNIFEEEWILELLGLQAQSLDNQAVMYMHRATVQTLPVLGGGSSVVIVWGQASMVRIPEAELSAWAEATRARGARVGLMHISDEYCDDTVQDRYGAFDYVVRNYRCPLLFANGNSGDGAGACSMPAGVMREGGCVFAIPMLTVPLGYKSHFWDGLSTGAARVAAVSARPPASRQYAWNFIGQVKHENRKLMLEVALAMPHQHHKVILTQQWNDPMGLTPSAYRDVLLGSNFTLVPYGSSLESFRLSESLEAGSIPITVSHPMYTLLYGEPIPWPTVDDQWTNLEQVISETDVSATHARCVQWWAARKAAIIGQISGLKAQPHQS